MTRCLFASDLHGDPDRYEKLLERLAEDPPDALFLGGDLLPSALLPRRSLDLGHEDFLGDFLARRLGSLRDRLGARYPAIFAILGNDDGRFEEPACLDLAARGLWKYVHDRRVPVAGFEVYGYAYVPPTPFQLKDWERYDVSRYVDPGCVSPEEGLRSVPVSDAEKRHSTIAADLDRLAGAGALDRAIFLFHAPPYRTALDRAALDGQHVDHVPLDVHVGSIAIQRFIESRQPLLTLHGHVHESARLTGRWRDRIGRTHLFGGAHDGPELALVHFSPEDPDAARRELL
jgi:Icc-related predicted phosphoesterase